VGLGISYALDSPVRCDELGQGLGTGKKKMGKVRSSKILEWREEAKGPVKKDS
jgi:hypothetical protein